MRKTILALVPAALALGACQTNYGDPYGPGGYPPAPYPQEPYPPPGYPQPPISGEYQASGTEPFWSLTIGREMVFTNRGTGQTVVQPTPQPIGGVAGEIYRTPRLEVNIVHRPCNNGMSPITYPDTVQVYVDGRLYSGCGGEGRNEEAHPPTGSAPNLDRTRWTVIAVNGRPVPPNGEYMMEFDNGRLSAKFGCNGIGAGYTQTGVTVDAGALIGTQMACSDMSWERQGTAVLDQVMRIETIDPNRIRLTSSAGTIELRRRP